MIIGVISPNIDSKSNGEITMMDLGFSNGWREVPQIVKDCRKKDHTIEVVPEEQFRCVNIVRCHICNYEYRIDSSD